MSEPKALLALSMKGGVGKTTVSIGLARGLRHAGLKVGLLDVDIHGSAMPRALHLVRDPGFEPLVGAQLRPVEADGFQMFSIGLLFREETPNMWDGHTKTQAVQQVATTSIAWDDDLSWLVVDTPPTSGDEVQSLLEHLPNIFGSVIVTQPNDLSLLGITKTLNMLRETESPVVGILANMAGFTCPHCGVVSNVFDRDVVDIEELAGVAEVPYLGSVPFASEEARTLIFREVVDRILRQQPVMLHKEKGGVRRWLMGKMLT